MLNNLETVILSLRNLGLSNIRQILYVLVNKPPKTKIKAAPGIQILNVQMRAVGLSIHNRIEK